MVGSTLGITLEGAFTAAAFRLIIAGGRTLTGASRAKLESKLENTVLDGVPVLVMRLKDCTPTLGLEMSLERVKLEVLENTVLDGVDC